MVIAFVRSSATDGVQFESPMREEDLVDTLFLRETRLASTTAKSMVFRLSIYGLQSTHSVHCSKNEELSTEGIRNKNLHEKDRLEDLLSGLTKDFSAEHGYSSSGSNWTSINWHVEREEREISTTHSLMLDLPDEALLIQLPLHRWSLVTIEWNFSGCPRRLLMIPSGVSTYELASRISVKWDVFQRIFDLQTRNSSVRSTTK